MNFPLPLRRCPQLFLFLSLSLLPACTNYSQQALLKEERDNVKKLDIKVRLRLVTHRLIRIDMYTEQC